MAFLATILLLLSFCDAILAGEIAFSEVVPFPETKPTTKEYAIALTFKPQLYVARGCYPYAAVDADGNTNAGLAGAVFTWAKKCSYGYGETKGSQIYGRSIKFQGKWAIMYAWYFPKDTALIPFYIGRRHGWENVIVWLDNASETATISAVTTSATGYRYYVYSPPDANTINGTSAKILSTLAFGTHHYLKATTKPGKFQDLVMWDDLTDAARGALNSASFGASKVPVNDDNFQAILQKANPWSDSDSLVHREGEDDNGDVHDIV